MNDKQKKVIAWIKSGMDYTEGINILIEITHEQYYAGFFIGRNKTHADKLAYLLLKNTLLADIRTWKNFITSVQKGNDVLVPVVPKISRSLPAKGPDREISVTTPYSQSTPSKNNQILIPSFSEADTLEEVKPLTQYPAIIRRIIHQYAALFQERSRLHTTMVEMPASNAETICIKRAEIFNVIKSISERLEHLFNAKEAYDKKGIIPTESEIFPPEEDKGEIIPDLQT